MNRHQVQAVQMYMHKVLYFHFVKYYVFYQPFSVWKLFGLFIVKVALKIHHIEEWCEHFQKYMS